jgi:hypothetical protein
MTYKDNRDILSWKRMIENLQEKTDKGVEEYNEAQLGIEDQEQIETEHYNVVVSSNEMGIIVDVYDKHDKQREPLKSDQYWDEDVMEGKEPVTEGTWSIPETPEQVEKLTTLLKNPLDAETALDELYDVFGDDQLFDDLEVMKREEPETDVRHVVISRLKDMNFIKEVRENNKPIKEEDGAKAEHDRDVKRGRYGDDDFAIHPAWLEEDGVSAEDLVDIITHRIKMNKELMLSLLGDEGPEPLMNAIEDVADFYSGTTEVGSSDVSAMVDAVKKNLGHIEEKQVNELEDDGSLEYGDSEEDMAKALGMSQDEFWEFAEDIGVDQYGGLTKDNYQDVMDHIVDNEARYKQIHIFRKAGEFDESDEQLDEIIPAIAGVGRAALALAPKAKSIWNALKGTSKTASNKADLKAKAAELYGPTRTFPGGKVGAQFKNQAAGKAKAAELYGPTRTFPGGRVGGQHHLAKGPKTNVATKTTNAKTTTKSKHTGSKDGNVNYSAGGRYTQGIPKSKYNPKPK